MSHTTQEQTLYYDYDKRYNPSAMEFAHFHNVHELYFLENGKTTHFMGDKVYLMNSGDMLFIPKGVFHKTDNKDTKFVERHLFMFDDSDFDDEEILGYIEELKQTNYIHAKYFDKSSDYYETNLTDTERRIAYNYEMQMWRTGKINGVNYQDSLFRGIEVDGDSVDSDKIQFERALVNSQISNILKQAGVDTSSITKDCTFTVDPYSYEITVDGVDEETKMRMQNALNVGDNGKNLYKHIYYCSTQDGCESTQITKESKMKYEAYHQVYSYTGYELDKLEEKNGTYYTESGEDILDLVNHAVEDTGKVPKEYKQQMKNWIHDLVSTMSVKGWNNVSDMTLSILYGKGGLKDMKQLISYQCDADNRKRAWYSVT